VWPAAPGIQARQGGDVDDAAEARSTMPGSTLWVRPQTETSSTCRKAAWSAQVGLGIGAGQAVAGVVDQGVDHPALGLDGGQHLVDGVGLGQVGGDRIGLDAEPQADLGGQGLQPVQPARGQGHVIAVAGVDAGEGGPDAGGGAGDQGETAGHAGLCPGEAVKLGWSRARAADLVQAMEEDRRSPF
jgi:hypothetical protein